MPRNSFDFDVPFDDASDNNSDRSDKRKKHRRERERESKSDDSDNDSDKMSVDEESDDSPPSVAAPRKLNVYDFSESDLGSDSENVNSDMLIETVKKDKNSVWLAHKKYIPPLKNWPFQKENEFAAFAKYVFSNEPFKTHRVDAWSNSCSQAKGYFTLNPFQDYVKHLASPLTPLKRLLISSSVGSGKTLMVCNIILSFIFKSNYVEGDTKRPTTIYVLTLDRELLNDMWRHMIDHIEVTNKLCRNHKNYKLYKQGKLKEPFKQLLGPVLEIGGVDLKARNYRKFFQEFVEQKEANISNTVLIMDEVHCLVDPAGRPSMDQERMLKLGEIFRDKAFKKENAPRLFVGLTGSPEGRNWQTFVRLHNIMCIPGDEMSERQFQSTFLKSADQELSKRTIEQYKKCTGERDAALETWQDTVTEGAIEFMFRMRKYLVHFEAFHDKTKFVTTNTELVKVKVPHDYLMNTLSRDSSKDSKDSKAWMRSRFVRDDRQDVAQIALLIRKKDRSKGVELLRYYSPVTFELIKRLRKRTGKAVVYAQSSDAYCAKFVTDMIRRFLPEVPLYYIPSRSQPTDQGPKDDDKSEELPPEITRDIKDFNATPVGDPSEAPILVLGGRRSTGVNLSGGVREMHILNVVSGSALDTQVRGRPFRMCSHKMFDNQEDWKITYFQYISLSADNKQTTCDLAVRKVRKLTDQVMSKLKFLLRFSAMNRDNVFQFMNMDRESYDEYETRVIQQLVRAEEEILHETRKKFRL